MAVGVVPAYRSPLIQEIFSQHPFPSGSLPNLALAGRPQDGFSPVRLENGTEVLFFPRPEALPAPLASKTGPLWDNGLGLVLFRNQDAQVLGATFLHSAIRNEWNAIKSGAFQCLGGLMLFSDAPRENKAAEALIADVIRKATAMTTKWQFIDMNLESIGHSTLANLGGGKATASHPAGEKGRRDAVTVTASVSRELGIFISGSDQNMTASLCTYFSELSPFNFMGAVDHAFPTYGGMADPSPWTARGVYEVLKTFRRNCLYGHKGPIFFQGYGNVGASMVRLAAADGHPISGILDIDLEKLIRARRDHAKARLFLQVSDESDITDEIRSIIRDHNIRIVTNLVLALAQAPETALFSPNAGPSPITQEVAEQLGNSEVRAVIGATDNVFDTIEGSIKPLADLLQSKHILVPNDSETNQMGALSLIVRRINLNEEGLMQAVRRVGNLDETTLHAFRMKSPPQIARDDKAREHFERLLREGLAVMGDREVIDR